MKCLDDRLRTTRRIAGPAFLVVLFGASTNTFAQEVAQDVGRSGKRDPLATGTEVFEYRYLNQNEARAIIGAFEIVPESLRSLRSKIFVRFKNPAEADRAREILRKLDIPPRKIEVHCQLVLASNFTFYERNAQGNEKKVFERAALERKLISELKKVFRFENYHLLGRSRLVLNSGAMGEAVLGIRRPHIELTYNGRNFTLTTNRVTFTPVFIDEGKGVIQLQRFAISSMENRLLIASLNIKNGDTVVVGSSDIDGEDIVLVSIVKAKAVSED